MIDNFLHIEVTNRCVLGCPACARTTWSNITQIPLPKADLDLDAFEKFLDCPGGRAITNLSLCGDMGDCIYYPDLFEFIRRFRNSKTFRLATAGSHQTKEFWTTLASLMTKDDTIVFGIDGLEDTNHLYRRNSNWSSIMMGLDIMLDSPARVIWQTIIFNFNHDRLDQIREFAEAKGAEFLPIKSHRYEDNSLVPPKQYIELEYLHRPEYKDNNIVVAPRCTKEKVVTSDGYLLPCDWIRNPKTFYKSQLWKQKSQWMDRMSINNINYDQATAIVEEWADHVRQNSINAQPVDALCKMKCRECLKRKNDSSYTEYK